MKNLRITPKRKFVDTYGTGDNQAYNVFEVRRDWEQVKDGFISMPTPDALKEAGVVIETFNSEANAKMFIASFELLDSLSDVLNLIGNYQPMDGGNEEDSAVIEKAEKLLEKF